MSLKPENKVIDFGKKTYIMGILNLTPDSFSDGGRYWAVDAALNRAHSMIEEGADILDLGAESTRPGAEPLTTRKELDRLLPVLKRVVSEINVPVSVDTYKSEVARQALEQGAFMINDISGLRFDEKMAGVVAEFGASVVLMHIKGNPRTMQDQPVYDDLLGEIRDYLRESIKIAQKAGVEDKNIIIDPGIGFGKTIEDNLEIINQLDYFKEMGYPVLLGTSRKSFIGNILNLPVEDRVEGTASTIAIGIDRGADIVRVHDVKEMTRVASMTDAIVRRGDSNAG